MSMTSQRAGGRATTLTYLSVTSMFLLSSVEHDASAAEWHSPILDEECRKSATARYGRVKLFQPRLALLRDCVSTIYRSRETTFVMAVASSEETSNWD